MGWWIALGVLTLFAILPVGIRGIYNADGPLAWLLIGPIRIKLYPQKPKQKQKDRSKGKKKSAASGTSAPKKTEKGGSLSDFMPLIRLVLDFLGDFKSKLRVDVLQLKLVLAGDDPCDLAVNYGRAWAALGNLMPHLERIFVIKKRDLEVECDFTSDKTLVNARLDLTITVGRLLVLVVCYGFSGLREFLKLAKISKGGAKV